MLTRVSAGAAPQAATTAVLEDRAGRVWAVSDSTLHRLRDGRWDVMRDGALGRAEVVSVREDLTGAIWVGTRQGVFRTRDGDSFQLVDDGVARETSEGADGALWMTDPAHGARRQGARPPLTGIDGRGMRLLHDSRGNLWVATTGQGLWRVRDTANARAPLIERATTQTGLSSDAVQSLLEDREGNIWVGTMLGLHSLTPQELTPLASGALVQSHPSRCGRFGVGGHGQRPGAVPPGRRHLARNAASTKWDIRSLFRDARGHAWAETDHGFRTLIGGRLLESPHGDTPRRLAVHDRPTEPSTRCSKTHTARRGPEERRACGGFATGRWSVSASARGCRPNGCWPSPQSDDGCLWLAVDRGPLHAGRRAALVRLHPSDFDRAASGHVPVAGYKIYDALNGLAGVPLEPVTAARSRDGSLWFAFGGSLTVVDPEQVVERTRPRRRARADRRRDHRRSHGRAGRRRALPAGTRKVQIDYTALRLTAPRQIRFRYRLDGFDRTGSTPGARRQAYYTNLAPGSYVFRVQASGDGGAWTVPEAQWPFAVRPAFHQTGWFYALCGTALLLAAWGAAQTRVWLLNRQFAATLAERTRLSREIHDTMLQSLVGVALQVQAIARRCAPEAAEQQSQLVALAASGRGVHARGPPGDPEPALAHAGGVRPRRRARRNRPPRRSAPPTHFDVSADACRGHPRGHRRRTAAHRAGSDHQRGAPCRRDAHPGRSAPGRRRRPPARH